jgi:hypothetical protein
LKWTALGIYPAFPQSAGNRNTSFSSALSMQLQSMEISMGRYFLLWMLGVPLPILLLIWAFGGLN